MYSRHIKSLVKWKICLENSDELVAEPVFCNDNLWIRSSFLFRKAGLTMVSVILKIFWMKMVHTFKFFKEKYRINTNYITYTGSVHAIKCYICRTGLTIEGNGSVDLIKTLKIIYSYTQQKGAHLYYEVLTQINQTAVRSGKRNWIKIKKTPGKKSRKRNQSGFR